jgi:hypothetical protein
VRRRKRKRKRKKRKKKGKSMRKSMRNEKRMRVVSMRHTVGLWQIVVDVILREADGDNSK